MQLPLGKELPSLQTLLLFSAILLILASYVQRRRRQQSKYPPGPLRLPIFANVFQIDIKKPHISIQECVRKYGNIFSMDLLSAPMIVVTGLPLIKEVLVNQGQVFVDHPRYPLQSYIFKINGLFMSNGQEWKDQRRFTLMTLRNFGLGKKTLELRIQEEAIYLTEAIREEKGKPFNPHFQINNAVSNIICSVTFGNRFEYHDSQFRELLKSLNQVSVLQASWECQFFDIFPRIMKLLPGAHKKLFREFQKLESFVVHVIKKHKEDQNSEEAQDFIDAYLKELSKYVRKYGNIFSMKLLGTPTIIVSGLPLIKEVLVNQGHVFVDRPRLPLQSYSCKINGLFLSNGQEWKDQRRFTIMTLKNFGLGKKTLELRIQEEAIYFIEAIREEKGKPFNPHFHINNAVSNIICSVTFGNRFEYHDSKFQELLKSLNQVSVLQTSWECQFFNIFPRIMKCLPGAHKKLFREFQKLESFVAHMIKQHKEDQNSEEAQDFIDAYLKELSKGNISSNLKENNLVSCTLDLFFAGTESTSTTLRWALLYMAFYPEIQGKIQAEIDRVVGQSRQPTMADRENMPYTNAAVHEVQRMGNIIPLNPPRVATVDTTVAGYHMPKGTKVVTNMTSLHRDPKEWATPETFNPEHFLENGEFKKRESFLPFSAGKRVCLGEKLARAELLLQRFTFQAPPDTQLSLDSLPGLTFNPVPYKICALPRETPPMLSL
ncbi:cytochrome P450 2J4-like isoform X2 [Monodelphis domestica]|uniref:cytochrome P450 2J4-like isoform X2 n=2 Tax=Monodelphis domestica TaxID=13616 RepID=UPI0024E20672|nr:cytochrome P450 2J4-like isoform X2 [Monodelphis domestica]